MTTEEVERLVRSLDREMFLDLSNLDRVEVQLAYSRDDNFTGVKLYGDFSQALVHRLAFDKMQKAVHLLKQQSLPYRFLIYDALRPWRLQKVMFSYVENTPQEPYVAHPQKGSLHNYGLALDLTLIDEHGNPLDMGSGFDQFDESSQPQLEPQLFAEGRLTETHLSHRRLLRKLMEEAGFMAIPNEWWHFNACSLEEAKIISRRVD